MPKPLRVVLADDERPARRFLANLLKTFPDVEVVGEASNGREVVELIAETRPALVLLDLQMPELGGLDAARLLKEGTAPMSRAATVRSNWPRPRPPSTRPGSSTSNGSRCARKTTW